jgi:hypothetical protein
MSTQKLPGPDVPIDWVARNIGSILQKVYSIDGLELGEEAITTVLAYELTLRMSEFTTRPTLGQYKVRVREHRSCQCH